MTIRTDEERRAAERRAERMTLAQLNAAYLGRLVEVDYCGAGCCGTKVGIVTEVEYEDCEVRITHADGDYGYFSIGNILRMQEAS